MRELKPLVLLFVASALCAPVASAQTCVGLPSFVTGSVHLNVAGEFSEAAQAYGVGLGGGRPDNLFANLGVGQVLYDDLDQKRTYGFLEFGYQMPVRKAQFCPIAGGSYAVGPNDDAADIKSSSPSATAGVALGLPIGFRSVQLIPNAAVRYEHASEKADEAGVSTTDTFRNGVIDLGLGLVILDRFSVQPIARIRFGGDSGENTFGVFASVSFPWRAQQ